MVVRPREQFLGTITQLDKFQSGTVTAFGAEMDDVSGVVMGSRALQPATGVNKGSFWVLDDSPTIPKFTDSNGNTFTLCYCEAPQEQVGFGEIALVDGYAFVSVQLPADAIIVWSRKTPIGVLGEVYITSQDTTGFALTSTSDFDNSVITWAWFSTGSVVASGQVTMSGGIATVTVPIPEGAKIVWSRNTPAGVLGEIYLISQTTSEFVLGSTSDFENSVINWSWISNASQEVQPIIMLAGCRDVPATSIVDGYTRVAQRTTSVSATMTLIVELITTTGTAHAVLIDVTASQVVADLSTSSTTGVVLSVNNLAIIGGHIYMLQVGLTLPSPGSNFATICYAELR